jgi:hypothetical protein
VEEHLKVFVHVGFFICGWRNASRGTIVSNDLIHRQQCEDFLTVALPDAENIIATFVPTSHVALINRSAP